MFHTILPFSLEHYASGWTRIAACVCVCVYSPNTHHMHYIGNTTFHSSRVLSFYSLPLVFLFSNYFVFSQDQVLVDKKHQL